MDLDALLERIPEEACDRLGFERALLWTAYGDALHIRAGHTRKDPGRLSGLMSCMEEQPTRLDAETLVSEAARTRRPVLSSGQPLATGRDAPLGTAGQTRFAATPLVGRDRLIGALRQTTGSMVGR